MKSIEFGYQLAQEELETESIQEEKTSWSREEVIAYGKLTFEVGRNFQLTGENNLPEVEQNL